MIARGTNVKGPGGIRDKDGSTTMAAAGGGRRGQGQQRSQSSQSLNHLLGFTMAPRERSMAGARRSARRSTGHHVHSQERYVMSQYRFVLKPTGDYTVHFADPDIYFHWPDILQVIVPTSSPLSNAIPSSNDDDFEDENEADQTCPICLSKPSAARMTKCGHIFCYPCILHYLALSDASKWRKCPVCGDSIHSKDVKVVKWFDPMAALFASETGAPTSSDPEAALLAGPSAEQHKQGNTIKLRLMQRPDITTLALPRSTTWPSAAIPPHSAPWHFAPDVFQFAKFFLATSDYMVEELQQDMRELERLSGELLKYGGVEDLEQVFVQSAVVKVEEQIEKAKALHTASVTHAVQESVRDIADAQEAALPSAPRPKAPVVERAQEEGERPPEAWLALQAGISLPSTPKSATPNGSNTPTGPPSRRRNINPPTPVDTNYYFYQAASGHPIFLQPLDIRVLKAHFHSYSAFPDILEVPVEGSDEGSMNDEMRRKCRYLSHLATGCNVTLIEADLTKIVPPSTLEPFQHALRQRSNRRTTKRRKEDRAKAKADQEERDRAPIYSSSRSATTTLSLTSSNISTSPSSITSLTDFPSAAPHVVPTPPVPSDSRTATGGGGGGAWGRPTSFASIVGSNGASPASLQRARRVRERDIRERGEWDADMESAWHDFEESAILDGSGSRSIGSGSAGRNAGGGGGGGAGGGGKKGRKKGVVLNLSGGRGAR